MEPYGWVEKEVSQGGWFVRQVAKPDAPGNWIPLYSAPPLAESVGDVRAAAREIVHFLCANESSFVSVSAWTGEQCEQQLAAIIRRHMVK